MKSNFFFLTSLSFFLFSFASFPQASIKGTSASFAGKEVRLYSYTNYITQAKILLEATIISPEGKFVFNLPENIAYTTFYAILRTENFAATLFIEPGSEVEISFNKPDSVTFPEDRLNYIDISILNPGKNDLNILAQDFDEKYNRFVQKNYSLFMQKSARHEVDSFKTKIWREFDLPENAYLKTYIKYFIASLDIIATSNRSKAYTEYLAGMPVEYTNYSYMLFFNEFYNKQFESFSEPYIRESLLSAINVQKSYENAMSVLTNEKLLGNEKIRELVLIKGLYENYDNREFDKKSIQVVLQQLVKKTLYPENREIAMNVLQETGKLGVGAKAPDFSLFDRDQKPVKLSDFKGKYVYLDFWATWCVPCIKEMPAAADLKEKYGKDIVFISISVDKDLKTMQKFLKKKKEYNWIFLHYGSFPGVKELYNVQAIPAYFLIDPEGVIIQSPAYRPSGKIEETFIRISTGKRTKRKSYEWD